MLREANLDESTKALCAKAITGRSFNTRNDPAYLTDLVERITVNGGTLPDGELAYGLVTGQMTGDALRVLIELRKHLRGSHGAVIAGAYARLNAALDGQGAGGSDATKAAGGAGGNDAGNADNAVSNTNADAAENAVPGATNAGNAASAAGSVALNATNPAGTTGAVEPAGTTNSIEPAGTTNSIEPAALLNRPNAAKAAPQDPTRLQAKCDAQLQLALGIEKVLAEGSLLAALKPGDPNSLLNAVIDLFAPKEARAEGLGGEGEEKEPVPAAGPGEQDAPGSQGLPEGELSKMAGAAAQNATEAVAPDRNATEGVEKPFDADGPFRKRDEIRLWEEDLSEEELNVLKTKWVAPDSTTHRKSESSLLPFISTQYSEPAFRAEKDTGVDKNLTLGVLRAESSGNPRAKNTTSTASGVMQITKPTAEAIGKELGMKNPTQLYKRLDDPEVAIYAAAVWINRIKRQFVMDDDRFIIIAFNQGKNGICNLIKEYAINVAKIDPKILSNNQEKSDVPAFEAWLKSLPEKERDSMFAYALENTEVGGNSDEEQKANRERLREYIDLVIKTKNSFAKTN